LARVLAIDLNDDPVAFPYAVLAQQYVLTDAVGGQPIVVLWQTGARSPLGSARVADGRDVGAAAAFSRRLDGAILDFKRDGDDIVDLQTGSRWRVDGRAVDGPLKGKQLEEVVATNHFWFSWAAFHPTTRVYAEAQAHGLFLFVDGGFMRIRSWKTVAPLLVILAAGCASQPAPAPTSAPGIQPAAPSVPATRRAAAPTQALATAPVIGAPPAPALGLFEGVPHGVTPEGFYFLGQPHAPVTMTDYSDFL